MKDLSKRLLKINLVFIFIFLNIWDYVTNREFFNAMAIGIFMLGPVVFLWWLGKHRAIALLTLISVVEFVMIAIFIAESIELSGLATTMKSVFWLPYLAIAGYNSYWGLNLYYKKKKHSE